MRRLIIALAVITLAPTVSVAEPILFIASIHNLNFAKIACDTAIGRGFANEATECKTVEDFRWLGRVLENRVIAALAVNTRCGGVTVIQDFDRSFDGKVWEDSFQANLKIRGQSDHWELFLDYRPGYKTFGWSLIPKKAGLIGPNANISGPIVDGEGDATKAADQICTVVTGRGATIR
jgi:hypothetical protein